LVWNTALRLNCPQATGKFVRKDEKDELVFWGIDLRSEHER
jgi:hypothetical protein